MCLLTALFAMFASAGFAQVAQTPQTEKQDTIFILDASGSMWGQIQGKSKIEIAREVLSGLIKDMPAAPFIGLVAYGHSSKTDCNDVQILVPVGPADKNALIAKINSIVPKGMTPITLSIKKTAEAIKSTGRQTNIILVSDGKETCPGDPCATTAELKKSGAKFTMNVVGFDVTAEERTQLECIAKAGGGAYFAAKNSGELLAAAKKAVEYKAATGFLKITAVKSGKTVPGTIEIFKQGSRERYVHDTTVTEAAGKGTELPPGIYDIKVIDEQVQTKPFVALKGVKIEAGKTMEQKADFSGGEVRIAVQKNGRKSTASIYAYQAGSQAEAASTDSSAENPVSVKLVPGTYDIVVKDTSLPEEPVVKFAGLKIESGTVIDKTADFSEGYIEVTVTKAGQKHFAWVYVNRAGTNEKVTNGDTSATNPEKLSVMPGTYDVIVKEDTDEPLEKKIAGIIVEGGKVKSLAVSF